MTAERLIQVCGDPTVDWLSVHNAESEYVSTGGTYFFMPNHTMKRVGLSSQAGGAALATSLLARMTPPSLAGVQGVELEPRLLIDPKDTSITRSWTKWRAYSDPGQKKLYFRLAEWLEFEPGSWDYAGAQHRQTGYPNLLVIVDDGLGFAGQTGDQRSSQNWPQCLVENPAQRWPEHIILKLALYGDGRRNALLQHVVDLGLGGRTTLITSLRDLRACAVKVGAPLSWETTLEEIVSAVLDGRACPFTSPEAGGALAFQRVIVTLGTSGAVIVGRDGDSLVFDRSGQEGDYERQFADRGQMMGYNVCVLGALSRAWAENPIQPDWVGATWAGIALARLLHRDGYEVFPADSGYQLRYPCDYLATAYEQRPARPGPETAPQSPSSVWDLGIFEDRWSRARDAAVWGKWSILEDTLASASGACGDTLGTTRAVLARAKEVAVAGPHAALAQVPMETIGRWRSADRNEIEGVRSVSNAMLDYLRDKSQQAPLCVAVFGPPGSGKSFAIKEIAKKLEIGKDAHLTYNLSQFSSPADLPLAFHQIRDLNLKGQMPLVFWDEFDGRCGQDDLGWLRYFLAPMQDGEFTEQGRTHQLGRAIFVFAGATRQSFDEFCRGNGAADISVKKPDFVSRLRAYINVRGPNGNPNTLEDRLYMIRRAFLLNTFLETSAQNTKKGGRFVVEPAVLNALLRVSHYRHGARSMEALVRMSNLSGKRKYELSSLPPRHILRMHVDTEHLDALTRYGYREMLRVGITGHIGLDPSQLGDLQEGVDRAVRFLQARFADRFLTVFSPMAAGADRLVARALLELAGTGLIAILPVPRDEYARDFGSTDDHSVDYVGADLRQEFHYWLANRAVEVIEMPPVATRDEAYAQAGYFVVRHSDVLVAVWDGQPAQGKGGTAEIVARAQECGKPIIWIAAANYKRDPAKRTSVPKHGVLKHMNLNGAPDGAWVEEQA